MDFFFFNSHILHAKIAYGQAIKDASSHRFLGDSK